MDPRSDEDAVMMSHSVHISGNHKFQTDYKGKGSFVFLVYFKYDVINIFESSLQKLTFSLYGIWTHFEFTTF